MNVVVDLGLCQGYGNCVAAAPDFFDLDESGQVLLLKATAETEEERKLVLDAVPLCPMSAIKVAG